MHYIAAMEQATAKAQPPQTDTVRVSLPLIGRDTEPTVVVANEDIEDAFDAEDTERYASVVVESLLS
jgi:hypothetical protein